MSSFLGKKFTKVLSIIRFVKKIAGCFLIQTEEAKKMKVSRISSVVWSTMEKDFVIHNLYVYIRK